MDGKPELPYPVPAVALGLRVSELTRLVIGSFEPGHGQKIGLLRVKGKKQKAAGFICGR